MIKIDTSKINNWKDINKKHSEWFFEEFKSNFLEQLGNYKNLEEKEKWFLSSLFEVSEKMDESNIDLFTKEIKIFSVTKFDKVKLEFLKTEYQSLRDEAKEVIKNCFKYDKRFINDNIEKWCRNLFLYLANIVVCPYCNRQYITKFNEQEKEKKRSTADLDHFYPQAQYPYLALSLYNFIPSCHTCNSTMKNQDKIGIDTHIYPYTDSMEEDIKFTIETDSFMDNVFTKNQNLNIDIDVISTGVEKTKKIKNSLETFKLKEVYKNSHSKYVGDLIHNFQKYPKSYTKALGEIFLEENKNSKEHQEKLQILNDNFQEIIKKPYTDKIEKGEPLAKLTKDIMEELGIK
ncbi:MAG: hypothetical protein JXM74_02850 [Fusobacteriaceae bacterium]|nr:hypothetical protein [Fusobacteriaceae bacterium]MBN2837670.1 hypothetical protein [Fusobacteriaceae bacterium]